MSSQLNEDRNRRIIEAWNSAKVTRRQIMAKFNLTKGMLAGILNRAKKRGLFVRSGEAGVPPGYKYRDLPVRKAQPRKPKAAKPVVVTPPKVEATDLPPRNEKIPISVADGSLNVPLDIVQESGGCRWPTSTDKPHRFCGLPRASSLPFLADDTPYCPFHRSRNGSKHGYPSRIVEGIVARIK